MKILPISNYYQKNYSSKTEEKKYSYSNSNTSFNGWNLKVLELSEDTLKTVAKHFYKSTEEELKEVTTETLMGFIRLKTKSLAAYYKLKGAVDKAKLDVDSIRTTIQTLENKTNKNAEDIKKLATLKKQLKEYEIAFENRKNEYYTNEFDGSSLDNDLDWQIQLAKSDGSWYDY